MRVWWLIWFYAVDFYLFIYLFLFFIFPFGFKGDSGVIRDVGETVSPKKKGDVGETVGKKRIGWERERERERVKYKWKFKKLNKNIFYVAKMI